MNKIVEIFTAWGISFNPNDSQAELAAERIKVCNDCEFKQSNPIQRCTVCGCALKAKIFTPVKDACPKGKWNEVDMKLLNLKKKKSLI
jgi:hypothetical protein